MNQASILLCTVGTGDKNKIEETLLLPLKKSIHDGEWTKVILLPSQETLQYAERLRSEVTDVVFEIHPLPLIKQEDDPDACFAHFDRVLSDLIVGGATPATLVADFTRGTKAMSAALVLATVRHGLPKVRYLSGGRRDERGMVVSGTEIVTEVKTTIATARRRLDDVLMFFRQGNFPAVIGLLTTTDRTDWPAQLGQEAITLSQFAAFYAAWDRLDYTTAVKAADDPLFQSANYSATTFANVFAPTSEVVDWVKSLAADLPATCQEKALPLRRLLVDLFSNGERRLRDHQYEDALLRAYRVLELLGQVRLFDRGYDSAALPPDDPQIKSFQETLIRKKSEPLTTSRKDGLLQAPREKVSRLLKHLGDEAFGQELISAAEFGEVKARSRNQSVLIHGFDAVAGSQQEPLIALYQRLEQLIFTDTGLERTRTHLQLARFPNFGRSK